MTLRVIDDDRLQDTEAHTVHAGAARITVLLALDEGAGAATADGSGLGNDGALLDGPAWTPLRRVPDRHRERVWRPLGLITAG